MPASDRYVIYAEPCMEMTCAHEWIAHLTGKSLVGLRWNTKHEKWPCQSAKPCAIHQKELKAW